MDSPRLSFRFGCGVELLLLLLAGGLAWWLGVPWFADLRWNVFHFLAGLIAAGPLLVGFALLLRSDWLPLRRIRDFLEAVVRPTMGTWTPTQLATISLLAGLCEETLFRGVLQGAMTAGWGAWPALIVASAFFGLCHWITHTYALLAWGIGIYLGLLWLWTGNLLAPIVTHAVYDFVALTWFLRSPGPPSPRPSPASTL